jgi:hypothetical protein
MPVTTVVFFMDEDGVCSLLVWLDRLPLFETDPAKYSYKEPDHE